MPDSVTEAPKHRPLDDETAAALTLYNTYLVVDREQRAHERALKKAEKAKDDAAATVRELNDRQASAAETAEAEAAYREAAEALRRLRDGDDVAPQDNGDEAVDVETPKAEAEDEATADAEPRTHEEASADLAGEATDEATAEDTKNATAETPADDTEKATPETPADDTENTTEETPANDTEKATPETPADDTGRADQQGDEASRDATGSGKDEDKARSGAPASPGLG